MDDSVDRLSDLPNEIIHLILLKLETKDVVQTTLLSKRWVNLWTTVTSLDFVISHKTELDFINFALELWNGTKIEKFKIEVLLSKVYDDMSRSVNFAIDREVEELHILYISTQAGSDSDEDDLWFLPNVYFSPPQSLYSSSSIRKLTLHGCNIRSSSNVRWDRLKSLAIEGGELSEDMINRVLCGSPQLETLRLMHWIRPHNVTIQSSSLKTLEIASDYYNQSDDELTISAPKLEVFDIKGPAYAKCLLMDTFSLTNVVLDFTDERAALLRETLSQILPAIQYVEAVKLSFDCSEVLRVMVGERPPFSNVKLLDFARLDNYELKNVFGILETFPKLENLIISCSCESYNENVIVEDSRDVGDLESLLQHLRAVDIHWFGYEEFGFIESLLKHATELRRIVIRNMRDWTGESEYREIVEEPLVCLLSSFPNVELVFYHE